MLSQLTPLLFYFHVTHPCIPERCPEAFRAVSPPRFLDGCTKFHVPSVHRAPSLPTHLHLNLSPALRTPGWHILSERKGRTFLTRLWQRVESIYGGAGGAEFSTLDWCVCFKSTVGSCGGGGQQPHTHTHTHTHSLSRARPALPAHGRLVRATAPPSFLEHQLALLAQSLVATAVVSAAAGTVGAGARGPRLRWALVLLSLPLPQPRTD